MSKIWRTTSKWPYLSHMALKPKSGGTFFSSTLKVGEKKVPLFFRFMACGLRYCNFIILLILPIWSQTNKMRNWRYLSPEATNLKKKGTLCSSTWIMPMHPLLPHPYPLQKYKLGWFEHRFWFLLRHNY